MELKDYMTGAEVEKLYNVKAATLRIYISRNEVIPEDCYVKAGNTWLYKKEWIEEKYKDKKSEQ